MPETVELWDTPQAERMVMLAGWRQWADAGSLSSGLPKYLVQRSKAQRIGRINNHGFYLYQIPGTHDLVRPVVKFDNGYPRSLESAATNYSSPAAASAALSSSWATNHTWT